MRLQQLPPPSRDQPFISPGRITAETARAVPRPWLWCLARHLRIDRYPIGYEEVAMRLPATALDNSAEPLSPGHQHR